MRLRLADPVRLAVGTLTALPVPAPASLDRRTAGAAMLLAPGVGLLLGALAGLLCAGLQLAGLAALPTAVLGIGALALATRGLHLDGLADTADGLASSYDRDRALEVMRLGNVGPGGVATVVLVLLAQVAALAQTAEATGWFAYAPPLPSSAGTPLARALGLELDGTRAAAVAVAVAVAVLAGRCALPLACLRGVPPARPSGLGATVAGTVGRVPAGLVLLLAAALAGLLGVSVGWAWWRGPLAVALAVLTAALVVARATRRLGGITGDVLGGCVELATAAALLALATA